MRHTTTSSLSLLISFFKFLPLSLSFFLSFLSPSTYPLAHSFLPAVYLLTLTVCAVNNWWSSLPQRVTGLGENVSPISLFILWFVFKLCQSQTPLPSIHPSTRIDGMEQPDSVCFIGSVSCYTCDHERVNAACLSDSRTEGGKGSLNEREAGGREEEEWQNDRVN